jgi:hypothetical protein
MERVERFCLTRFLGRLRDECGTGFALKTLFAHKVGG